MIAMKTLDEIRSAAKAKAAAGKPARTGIIYDGNKSLLNAAKTAQQEAGIIPVIFGNKSELNIPGIEFVETAHPCIEALRQLKAGQLDIISVMQESLSRFIKAASDPEMEFIGKGGQPCHAVLLQIPGYHKPLLVADCSLVPPHELTQKMAVVEHSLGVARKLGVEKPKVALLAAVEAINPAMPVTLEEAVIAKMGDRGQIKNAIIDGPLSFDCAISAEVAGHKGIKNSPVAGDPDIMIGPTLETADGIYKALVMYAGAAAAGVVIGGKVPVAISSGIDSEQNILNSIALAALLK